MRRGAPAPAPAVPVSIEPMESTGAQSGKFSCREWIAVNCDIIQVLQLFSVSICIVMLWLIFYSISKEYFGPTSEPVMLLVLFTTSKAFGMVVALIKIPAILGMMVMGIILKNVGYLNFTKPYLVVSGYLRKMTLFSILIPAAFNLDPAILRRMWLVLVLVSFIPLVIEVLADCVLAYFFLSLPWLWAILLGIIMCAAAPAIVIPCLFTLEEKGYGNVNGIHTLANASCILITIISIIYFGLVYGFVLAKTDDEIIRKLWEGPMEIGIGLVYGIGLGLIAWFIPHDGDFYVTTNRTIYIACSSLLALFGFNAFKLNFAGVIGSFTTPFVAEIRWRALGWQRYNPVRDNFKLVWRFFEPIAFALIGMEIDFRRLDIYDILIGSAIMLFGTAIRFGFTIFLIKYCGFNMKQTIFLALTYISKATVQAAIGPLALDYARSVDDETIMEYAEKLLNVTVASIIITSPLGVILMISGGQRLLPKGDDEDVDTTHQTSGMKYFSNADKDMRDQARRLTATFKQIK